jgi:broad specificity phosphatase PhoE
MSAVKPGDLPNPRYANFNAFLADMPNHDWLNQGTLVVLTRHGESVFNRLNEVFHGSMDSPLIDAGREQARKLGRVLRALPIRAVYASTVARARDTAEIIRGELGLDRPVIPDDGLIEVSHGILDSYPRDRNAAEVDAFLKRMENVSERERLCLDYGVTPQEADYAVARCRKRIEIIRAYCARNGVSEDDAIREAKEGTQSLDYTAPIDGESFAHGYARAGKFKAFLESEEAAPGALVVAAHGMFDKELLLNQMGVELISRKQLNRIRQDNCCINVLWRKKGSSQWQLFVLNDAVGPEDFD